MGNECTICMLEEHECIHLGGIWIVGYNRWEWEMGRVGYIFPCLIKGIWKWVGFGIGIKGAHIPYLTPYQSDVSHLRPLASARNSYHNIPSKCKSRHRSCSTNYQQAYMGVSKDSRGSKEMGSSILLEMWIFHFFFLFCIIPYLTQTICIQTWEWQ